MSKITRVLFVALFVLGAAAALAQGPLLSTGDLTYTFDSGVAFEVPENWILDTSGAIPNVSVDDNRIVVEMVEPEFIGVTAEDTAGAPLPDVLDYLLGLVGFEGERAESDTETFSLLDGREIVAYSFINNSNNGQTVLVLRFSNTHVAAMNIRHTGDLSSLDQQVILAIANSFDIRPPTQDDIDAAEAELTVGFSGPHTYESGVSFLYPEEYELSVGSDGLARLDVEGLLSLQMVDPNLVGIPAGETMEDVIGFAIGNSNIAADEFEPFDIGGREAVWGYEKNGSPRQTLVLVRFSDDTVGIIDVLASRALNGAEVQALRGIAASFDSATSELAGVSREDQDQSRGLFEQAMDLRDAGNLEGALPLLDQAVELDPTFGLANYWRAVTNQDLGNFEAALEGYRTTLELEPDQVQIHGNVAEMYVMLDDLESALAELHAMADAQGANASDALLGEIEMYERVLDGEFVEMFYVNRAARYGQAGQYNEAVEDLMLAIENDPTDALLYARLGVAYDGMGELREAVEAYTAGLEIEEAPVLYFNRGFAYQKGIREFSNSVILADNDLRCAVLLGDGVLTADQIAQAQRAINLMIISSDDYEPITDPARCEP